MRGFVLKCAGKAPDGVVPAVDSARVRRHEASTLCPGPVGDRHSPGAPDVVRSPFAETLKAQNLIRLDIISDVACPWCFIGKAYLDRALEAHPGHPFGIEWHPFQLNPDMPAGGMDRAAYLEAKFGGRETALRAYAPLIEHAATAGVELNLAAVRRTPNTLDAHRVIHWAGLEGRQTHAVAGLFRALWQEGRDIGDLPTLADIAASAGLDRAMTLRLLQSDADSDDIRARDQHARDRGVSGVPTFIIANRHVLQGAQPSDVWARVIGEVTARLADAATGAGE